MSQELFINGIDAETGNYILEGVTLEMIAKVARRKQLEPDEIRDIKIRKMVDQMHTNHLGVSEGINATDLAQTGWCFVFPSDMQQDEVDGIKDALKPLFEHRKAQSSVHNETFFKEITGVEGYRKGETKNDFLKRFGRGPGPANPKKIPYYVMLVGSPEDIPFSFQYQLDVQYAVGRIHFEALEDFHRYAISVVQAETGIPSRAKRATFWGVSNPDDIATSISSEHLIKPLANNLKQEYRDWEIDVVLGEQTTKSNLAEFFRSENPPSIIFSAGHGVGFNMYNSRQINHQGALICQDWPGPKASTPITDEFYFSADDLSSDANISGMIAFLFACYGGGTPRMDNFYHQVYGTPRKIAQHAFLAKLPQKMLSHPKGGALAVFAHVERAWTASILWDQTVQEVETFESTVSALLNGKPAGNAIEFINTRYAEISSDLAAELDATTEKVQDDMKIAGLWTSNNDARNYTLIGDPAVHLNLSE